MTAEWYYAKGDNKHGPVTEDRLRELAESGELLPTDRVWRKGTKGWVQADTVPELFPHDGPPPLDTHEAATSRDWLYALWNRLWADKLVFLLICFVGCSVLLLVVPFLFGTKTTYSETPWGSTKTTGPSDGALFTGTVFGLASLVLFITVLVMAILRFRHKLSHWSMIGEWNPVDGRGEPLEFSGIKTVIRGSSLAGTFIVHKDHRIEITSGGKVIEVWQLVKVDASELVIRDASGAIKRFKKKRLFSLDSLLGGGTGGGEHQREERAAPTSRGKDMDRPQNGKDSGISDPEVAKRVAEKKASIAWHAQPVEERAISEPEQPIFGGDGPCLKCKTIIWVEWLNTTVTMACPKCGFRFDHQQAMAALSAHDPGDNYKADEAAPAVEAVGILERAKALLARQEQTAGASSGESTTSRPVARPIPPEQGTGRKVGGIVAGFWNWLTKYKCPNCRSRKTSVLSNSMTDKRQVVKTNHAKDHRPQEVFNVATFESKIRCNDCSHEWIHEYELESPA